MLSERTPTGIDGLDQMLEGGIPKGRTVLLVGGPGTGKTILCIQFLVNGIREYGESGVFVSLEERKNRLYQAMKRFGWDLGKCENDGKFSFLDESLICSESSEVRTGKSYPKKRQFSVLDLANTVRDLVDSSKARRIAVDSLASLIYQYSDPYDRRIAILHLLESLTATGATCMTTMETKSFGLERSVVDEEYLADGVIVMQRLKVGRSLTRTIQIRKMRMTAADDQPRPYKIGETGISVFAEESVF